jgi:hypothetical protein
MAHQPKRMYEYWPWPLKSQSERFFAKKPQSQKSQVQEQDDYIIPHEGEYCTYKNPDTGREEPARAMRAHFDSGGVYFSIFLLDCSMTVLAEARDLTRIRTASFLELHLAGEPGNLGLREIVPTTDQRVETKRQCMLKCRAARKTAVPIQSIYKLRSDAAEQMAVTMAACKRKQKLEEHKVNLRKERARAEARKKRQREQQILRDNKQRLFNQVVRGGNHWVNL